MSVHSPTVGAGEPLLHSRDSPGMGAALPSPFSRLPGAPPSSQGLQLLPLLGCSPFEVSSLPSWGESLLPSPSGTSGCSPDPSLGLENRSWDPPGSGDVHQQCWIPAGSQGRTQKQKAISPACGLCLPCAWMCHSGSETGFNFI